MKKTLKLISLVLSLVLALSFTACGGGSQEEAQDDGQNPAMNFVGDYVNNRASIHIGAEGDDGINAEVTWASSAAENSTWTMSGTFDSENLQFEYSDCVKTDYVYGEDGEVKEQKEAYTGGHGIIKFTDGEELSLTWQDDEEHIADGTVFTYNAAVPSDEEGEQTGMANPWQTADSMEAAAEGAGLDGFSLAAPSISLGDLTPEEFRYMDGIAEVRIPVGAVEMTIRKGRASAAENGDISGDYNAYANEWTQNIKGLEVKCFGNREGEATKTIWTVDDTCYAILAYGAGGDDDFGLSPDDLNSLINGIQ
jgi:hypothetical protein